MLGGGEKMIQLPGETILRAGCNSHFTMPHMSLCLPIWDPTPGGHMCLSRDTPQA